MAANTFAAIKILRPGVYCAIQDLGRFGFRHLGVPCSGASDRQSLMYVNFLLGNPSHSAVLEIFGQSTEIEIIHAVIIAISGAKAIISVDGVVTNIDKPIHLNVGQKLKVEKLILGNVLYLGIAGGFVADAVMGSLSTIVGSHLKPLTKNDILSAKNQNAQTITNHGQLKPIKIDTDRPIEVTVGPEFEQLDTYSQQLIFSASFTITKDSNKMGYRLMGENLVRNNSTDLLTSAVAPGVVQLLPDGQLIILMRDCQTTGGYPRVLVVDAGDINQLAQRSPGQMICFRRK
jgi:antagonist of KipI